MAFASPPGSPFIGARCAWNWGNVALHPQCSAFRCTSVKFQTPYNILQQSGDQETLALRNKNKTCVNLWGCETLTMLRWSLPSKVDFDELKAKASHRSCIFPVYNVPWCFQLIFFSKQCSLTFLETELLAFTVSQLFSRLSCKIKRVYELRSIENNDSELFWSLEVQFCA